MARVTIYLRNGKEVDFETAQIKVTKIKTFPDGKQVIQELEYFKRDNGLSLIFADPSEIVAITRDTRKDDE